MKREKREIITIADNGTVTIPNNVRMSIGEIAGLFGIYYRTAKRHIRAIEKSGIVRGDDSMGCIVDGRHIYPEYYGLDMVIALAFQVQSKNAEIFREWLCKKAARKEIPEMPVISVQNYMLN
ncbi:MAG: hypothetical protein LBT43_01545 [Prevotella sp.]|jgi:DNA-binding Lrp family transcriptional regulator|nr:hypothetical protein [Prevotella sp.]